MVDGRRSRMVSRWAEPFARKSLLRRVICAWRWQTVVEHRVLIEQFWEDKVNTHAANVSAEYSNQIVGLTATVEQVEEELRSERRSHEAQVEEQKTAIMRGIFALNREAMAVVGSDALISAEMPSGPIGQTPDPAGIAAQPLSSCYQPAPPAQPLIHQMPVSSNATQSAIAQQRSLPNNLHQRVHSRGIVPPRDVAVVRVAASQGGARGSGAVNPRFQTNGGAKGRAGAGRTVASAARARTTMAMTLQRETKSNC